MTVTDRHPRSPGWTLVAVLLGIVWTLATAAALWLAWAMSGSFGFTQSVPRASFAVALPLALLAAGVLVALARGRGGRAGIGTAIAVLLVLVALTWVSGLCINAGMAAYDLRMHDAIPGPSGWG